MKILHLFKTYYPMSHGGVEAVIKAIAEHTIIADNIVEILVCGKKNETYRHQGIKVHVCKTDFSVSNNPFSIAYVTKLIEVQKNFDILHLHYPFIMLEVTSLINQFKKPYLITYHSDVVRHKSIVFFFKLFSKKLLKNCEAVVYTSPQYSKISYTSKTAARKYIIPLTISKKEDEGNSVALNGSRLELRSKNFILFLGMTRRYKGLDTLLDAAKHSERNFVIAGAGEEKKKLMARCKQEKIFNITFLGLVTDEEKKWLLKSCKFLVLPSDKKSEAFGVVILEAFINKKCVITSDLNTGVTFVNRDGDTGLIFKRGDHEELNSKIESLFQDKKLYSKLCAGAYKRVTKLFSSKENDKYIDIYEKCLQSRKFAVKNR